MEEKILMEGICNPVAGLAVKNGKGILTNKRFIFYKHPLGKTLVLGAWVNLTDGDFEYDIPLDQIETMETIKFRLGHALRIVTKDGMELKYGIGKVSHWDIAIKNAMQGE